MSFVVLVTATNVVSEPGLLLRIERLGKLSKNAGERVVVAMRDPELDSHALLALARRLRAVTLRYGMKLLVNDRCDVALLAGADGVHLGRRSVSIAEARSLLPRRSFVSMSCHGVSDVAVAARLGADMAVLAPVFASPGKPEPLGLGVLAEARKELLGTPTLLVALGGVTAQNAGECVSSGAHGVAAIRADLTAWFADSVNREAVA